MKVCYTTICDVKYLAPALALYRSLRRVSNHSFRIYAHDDAAATYLKHLDLPGAAVFRLSEYVPEKVMELKKNRSSGSFAFTIKSFALIHALQTEPGLDWVGYFDVDVYLFSDPVIIVKGLPGDKSASFTPHRFSPSFRCYEPTVGRFNAGYVSFKNSSEGIKVLKHWQDLCVKWCHDFVQGSRYGDQKYLDDLAERYTSIDICQNKGANAAPWNISDTKVTEREQKVFIDEDPLVFYHFQGLKVYGTHLLNLYAGSELIVMDDLLNLVYKPYVTSLDKAYKDLVKITNWQPYYTQRSWKIRLRSFVHRLQCRPNNLYCL